MVFENSQEAERLPLHALKRHTVGGQEAQGGGQGVAEAQGRRRKPRSSGAGFQALAVP